MCPPLLFRRCINPLNPLFFPSLAFLLPNSYISKVSWMLCLIIGGYLLVAYARPVYRSWSSRHRPYDPISSGDDSRRATMGPGESTNGEASESTHRATTGAAWRSPIGTEGGSPESQQAGVSAGWRPYGSTDEAPAGAGCLPASR